MWNCTCAKTHDKGRADDCFESELRQSKCVYGLCDIITIVLNIL